MDELRWDYYPRVAQDPHARNWIALLMKLQKAPKTIDAYARCLDDLIRFFERADLPLIEAQRGDIASYLNDLHQRTAPSTAFDFNQGKKGWSNATIQQRLTTARLWYDYLIYHKIRLDQVNPVGRGTYTRGSGFSGIRERGLLPRHERQPWIPGDDEWDTFLNIVVTEEPLRNQLMVFLAYEGALRRSELLTLQLSDIDWPQMRITIRSEVAKNNRGRLIFYGETTEALLVAYVRQRQKALTVHKQSDPRRLFLSESKRNPGQPLSIEMWNKIVQRIAKCAGLPHFTTHTFRHLRLTDYARCHLELYEIALLAGHKSLESTQLYINLSGSELGMRVRVATQHLTDALRKKVQHMQVELERGGTVHE